MAHPLLRPALNVAIAGGTLLAIWPLGQFAYGKWSQRQLAGEFQRSQMQAEHVASPQPPTRRGNSVLTAKVAGHGTNGPQPEAPKKNGKKPATRWRPVRLIVPEIGMDLYVVQGTSASALRRGPGHFVQTALPGQGNCAIAGHRNIYGSPFGRLDELLPGATISLATPDTTYRYTLRESFLASDMDFTILAPPPKGEPPLLTLVTCTTPHTTDRMVLQATLEQ